MSTRIKINLTEGTIELEGSESFVEKHLEDAKSFLTTTPKPSGKPKVTPKSKPRKKGGTKAKKQDLKLIPMNLKGGGGKPSLMDFFEKKSPRTQQEIVTVFVFYFKKYLNIDEVKPGHALYCYTEMKKKKPLNIYQVFRDTGSLKGWLEPGIEPHTAKITIGGENLVEQDLPRTKRK